ncbi:hypothetical protein [Microlunatus elymi]|uniref:hypothetical protein n=1 Tax=Microlunatus elymi TaxID=2596828 RepID=UPI001AEFD58D|nr:hypothetical protein [Microlunatus elymi]
MVAIIVGAGIGAGVGLLTRVHERDGVVLLRATAWAAILWIVGMGLGWRSSYSLPTVGVQR